MPDTELIEVLLEELIGEIPLAVKASLLLAFTSLLVGIALVKLYGSLNQITLPFGRLTQSFIQASIVIGFFLVYFGAIVAVLPLVVWVVSLFVAGFQPTPASLHGNSYDDPSNPGEAR